MSLALVKYLPVSGSVPFLKARIIALVFSALMVVGSLAAFSAMGINFGIDFRGGIQMTVQTAAGEHVDIERMRSEIDALDLGVSRIQETVSPEGDQIIIALPLQEGEGLEGEQAQQAARLQLEQTLAAGFPDIEVRSVDVIGGAVSGELIVKGAMAIVVALFLMLIYIWFRFEWQYSIGAIAALTHDVIATVGMFAITQMTFDLSTVAAILTIVGYSMNDTVVVYDRIRENLRKYKKKDLAEVLNLSINDTLSRTILTSLTTLVALISLWLIGGAALKGFAFAMIWGVLIGTYSSVFVAAPLLLFTQVKRESGEADE